MQPFLNQTTLISTTYSVFCIKVQQRVSSPTISESAQAGLSENVQNYYCSCLGSWEIKIKQIVLFSRKQLFIKRSVLSFYSGFLQEKELKGYYSVILLL